MPEVAAGRLVALKLTNVPQANRQIRLVHRKDKYLNYAMRAFMKLLHDSAATSLRGGPSTGL